MVGYKKLNIFKALFIIQISFSKTLPNPSNHNDDIPTKLELTISTLGNFMILMRNFGDRCAEASHHILKDETLEASNQPEILVFKQNLSKFIEDYESTQEMEEKLEAMEIFDIILDNYMEVPEEELTEDSKLIKDILYKYKCKELEEDFVKAYEHFEGDFKKKFEKTKVLLDEPVLEWYEKFSSLTDFEERLNAFEEFFNLMSV